MASGAGPSSSGIAVLLYNDAPAFAEAVGADAVPNAAAALQKYGALVRDVLIDLCGFREFSHVEFLEASSSYKAGDVTSPLAIAVGSPLKNEEGQLIGLSDVKQVMDVYGAVTATQTLPAMFTDRIGLDEEGMLGFSDNALLKVAQRFNQRLKLDVRFPDKLKEEDEDALAEVLGAKVPADTTLAPVHPEDVLNILSVFVFESAGPAPRASGPGLFTRGRNLVGRAVHAPSSLLKLLGNRASIVQQNLWRVEDFAVASGKVALKIARKAVRPVLLGYVMHRALSTIDDSKDLGMRMAKLPSSQAVDLFYREVLGPDYEKQMEQDLLDAVKEVEEGLITDDYADEKRLLSAAMLRRLEVEEWDKERMKHFYLGSYGLGPWYFDMEERLHNPYFIGGRAWNGPIEGWVGKNKTYHNDMPQSADPAACAIDAIEQSLGRRLTFSQRQRVLGAEKPRASDLLLAPGGLLNGVVDKRTLQEHLAE